MKSLTTMACAILLLLSACSGDTESAADRPPKAPVYSDAEWHWAEGWCSDNLGGVDGVELSSDERPEGFTECVQTQLPAAEAGIRRAQAEPDNVDAQVPVEEYCIMSAPPAIANDYERAWTAFDECLAEEFGIGG